MLSIEHVTKKYGNFTALEDINLAFETGVYGLLAPNGAGKTTLLKMITTLLFPTSGEILWNGENIIDMDDRYREIVGYLPQNYGYYRSYTPRKMLRYMATLQGMEKKTAEKRIEELLTEVSMSDYADKKMKGFSGGMIQRVGIAQAMLHDPKILVLDEPTAGLDPKERVRFRNLIHNISKERIVILSTHIVSDIETIAQKIVMLQNHTVQCCDSPAEILKGLDGIVWEVPEGTKLSKDDVVLAERQTEKGTVIRAAGARMPKGGIKVSPSLEDAFLYIFRDEGGRENEYIYTGIEKDFSN